LVDPLPASQSTCILERMFDQEVDLVRAVDVLLDADPAGLPADLLGQQILTISTQIRRLEAARATRLRAFEWAGGPLADGAGSALGWLQARTNISRHDAAAARNLGRAGERLPVMAAALAAGEISPAHLQVLAAATHRLDPDRVAADEKYLTDLAREFDPRTFSICVTRWVAVAFPEAHEHDTERAYDSRWLRLAETISGMVSLSGMLDPETARPLLAALDALARKAGPTDDRSQAQRNADALADLARIAMNTDGLPVTGGARPTITVLVREETLRGTTPLGETPAPATYPDGTPLTGAQLDRTGCDARYARLVVNALGEMLDHGRTTRDIPPALRKWLHLRDGGCRVAGCTRPAHATDAHHIRWWRHGGPTDRNNLVLLCAFHHYLVHDRGWTITMDAAWNVTFTRPDQLRSWTSQPRGPTQLVM